ncbi:MAG TPA: hypothetical protein VFF84_13670 [Sphingobium sp.]|nr:hypothetical protein [Sphingobium sp.]
MSEVKEMFKASILRALNDAADGRPDPEAPQSYAVGNIENAAIGVFESNDRLAQWMRSLDLDPYKGPDAVLGLGLLLTLDVKNNRRPEPIIDEDFEWPEEH